MIALPAKRSNRPLTQFACDEIRKFISNPDAGNRKTQAGNTAVECAKENNFRHCHVYLHDQMLMSLFILSSGKTFFSITLSGNLDYKGKPRKVAVERLNGLLDSLSTFSLLPRGVRIFDSGYEDSCYIGKGDNAVLVGGRYADSVIIKADHESLDFMKDYVAEVA
jgi:hypothetical protein